MSRRKNTFSKAIRHLKESPTNSTTGVYSAVPGTNSITTVIPGPTIPDESTIDWLIDGPNGADTSGLFDSAGNHKLISPPGDNSYILGPMVSMYYTYASPNWTRIGYLRESDRRMVNLGSITGSLDAWDGETGFQSYGQLTLEQAAWFKHTPKKPDGYRAFYPGPPSSSPDVFGRYYCTITGTPLAMVDTTVTTTVSPIDLQPEAIFAAIMDRKSKGKKLSKAEEEWLETQGYSGKNSLPALLAKLTWGIMDNILYGKSSYLLKGVPKGFKFSTNFFGAGPKNSSILNSLPKYKGQKLADWADDLLSVGNFKSSFVKNILGKNYYGQWFTDPTMVDVATGYAKGGTVSLVPRTQGVWGWKNWFSSNTSRSLGFQPETFQRAEDLVKALTSGKGRIDLPVDDPKVQKLLRRYATKVATNSKTLKFFARGIPIIGATISAVDAASRFAKGDFHGGLLSILSMTPGPAGWAALGAQVAVDTGAFEKSLDFMWNRQTGFNPETGMFEPRTMKGSRSRFGEAVEDQNNNLGDMNIKEAKQKMIEMGVPLDNPEEYANQVGLMMLAGGMNADIVEIMQIAILGVKLTKQQQKDIEEKMTKMAGVLIAAEKAKENNYQEPSLYDEDDPWALDKQQTQEGVELSEERKLSILNSLKEPVVIPETKQKSYKVRPGRRGKTNFQGMDKLVGDIKPQESFKKPQDIWSDGWQGYNARLSQDKKNIVLEKIGEGKEAWNYMLKYGAKMDAKNLEEFWGKNPDLYSYYSLNGKKYTPIRKEQVRGDYLVFLVDEVGKTSSMLQSELNEKLSEESDKEMLAEYNKTNEPIPFLNDPLVRRVAKRLKTQIDYPDKPAVKGYPNEAPPKMDKGWHPDFGKKYKYDKLDPVSAIAMRNAPTRDSEIDDNVKKASVKPKVVEDKKENWRDTLTNA